MLGARATVVSLSNARFRDSRTMAILLSDLHSELSVVPVKAALSSRR